MTTQTFIDALRDCLPNTNVRAEYQGSRYGVTCNAHTLVRDWDYLTSELERLTRERDLWQRTAAAFESSVTSMQTKPGFAAGSPLSDPE